MDVDNLLTPRSDDAPSGENLEYDDVFAAMELAAVTPSENSDGDPDTADPDYGALAEAAEAVLERSHDLRAAAFLAQARIRLGGIEAGEEPFRYMRECLERHWDTCFPEVEDDDVVMRANAVAALTDPAGIVGSLRRAPIASGRTMGSFSYRDVAIAKGEMSVPEDMEDVPSADSVDAAFADTPEEVLSARLSAARAMVEHISGIDEVFNDKAPGAGPDLDRARDLLARMVKHLSAAGGPAEDGAEEVEAADETPEPTSMVPDAAPAAVSGQGVGVIRSPADVKAALDQIIGYYRRAEPSSPVPILLERAKRLVSADFLTIVRDIAPEGMDNVTLVGGLEEDDDDD